MIKIKKTQELNLQSRVSIIIVNWNGKKHTSECLESIEKLSYSNLEVIIIDNDSNDGSQQYFRRHYPNIKLIQNEKNIGLARAFNIGISKALNGRSKYILCLNNDTILDKDFLKELITVGENCDNVGALCPKEYDYYNSRLVYAGGKYGIIRGKVYGLGEIDKGQYDEIKDTEMICGAAMMLKSDVLIKVGLFDPEYFIDWEDKDMSFRLTRRGYKLIYVPKAKFWHKRRGSTQGGVTPISTFFGIRNGLLFARKHYNFTQRIIFVGGLLFIIIPFFIFRSKNLLGTFKSIKMGLSWHLVKNHLNEEEIIEYLSFLST